MPDEASSLNVVTFEQRKTDQELANELRARLTAALTPVLVLMDEAKASGFVVNFNIGHDPLGRAKINELSFVRPF